MASSGPPPKRFCSFRQTTLSYGTATTDNKPNQVNLVNNIIKTSDQGAKELVHQFLFWFFLMVSFLYNVAHHRVMGRPLMMAIINLLVTLTCTNSLHEIKCWTAADKIGIIHGSKSDTWAFLTIKLTFALARTLATWAQSRHIGAYR